MADTYHGPSERPILEVRHDAGVTEPLVCAPTIGVSFSEDVKSDLGALPGGERTRTATSDDEVGNSENKDGGKSREEDYGYGQRQSSVSPDGAHAEQNGENNDQEEQDEPAHEGGADGHDKQGSTGETSNQSSGEHNSLQEQEHTFPSGEGIDACQGDTVSDYPDDSCSSIGLDDTSSISGRSEVLTAKQGMALVPYGVPIIYKSLEFPRTFWQLDYKKVTRQLVRVAGAKLPFQKILKSGFLSITAPSPEAALRLLQITTMADMAVEARIPSWYVKNVGKITGIPFRYTNSQLLDCFAEAGVIHVRRQITYMRLDDGLTTVTPEDCIILAFRPDMEMPETIALGFDVFPIMPYVQAPIQCYHCMRFGHTAAICRAPRRCKVCAGPHIYKLCTSTNRPCCANCGGDHAATFTGCPVRRNAALAKRNKAAYHQEWAMMSQQRPHRDRSRSPSRGGREEARSRRAEDETPRYDDGTPKNHRGEDTDSTDDDGNASTPSRASSRGCRDSPSRDCTPARLDTSSRGDTPARDNKSLLRNLYQGLYPKRTKKSERRFKHGFSRCLIKMAKAGLPQFKRPLDD